MLTGDQLNAQSPGEHDTEFSKANFAILDALYMICLNPQVLTNGKVEGERIGKLLLKHAEG
jgi:hypothetical protein